MKRRDVLRTASVAAPAIMTMGTSQASHRDRPMNVILFITDQERAIQHFPPGWAKENLPGLQLLQRNGLTFDRAFCSSCMCSPSRASLFTGLYPAQHQVTDTLTFGTDYSNMEHVLPRNVPNLATVMEKVGYEVVYKGKWHISKPLSNPQTEEEAELAWRPRDVGIYGFQRWTAPDAGENQDLTQFGGGYANNDHRYMTGQTDRGAEQEGVLDYLRDRARHRQPFFLVVSLVNPHDVLSYPRTWQEGGYHSEKWLEGDIELPKTWDEDLRTKPTAQRQLLVALAAGIGVLRNKEQRLAYLNFYGNLLKRVDAYLLRMMEVLHKEGLVDDTLVIRTSDHGEMGLAHGGMRQKMFNFYEEALRVPLVYSNPRLYPKPLRSEALVSHVDFLPTMAGFAGAIQRRIWEGVDYSHLLRHPHGPAPQDHVLFTYDDIRAGQNVAQLVAPPNRIVSIREGRWKLARYYDGDGNVPDQWEMYDLLKDPLETNNLARPGYRPTLEQATQRARLTARLEHAQKWRLQPLDRELVPQPSATEPSSGS
ncbi:MAG TPA: sulfatase-like hydrolase/transferase [Geminicoccus sp.]|jgi:arylsulfatase A-like enzyme|uniref:sulfatase-like hydrolase/transferase n=1 Tax=Geminicoccus sp. TaxID=2024832 RepID=UPI002E3650CC|nr:sulfatase-like hydrolase/transferase [Geminicoccus sp.]HEX2528309.1 sulfatase-like hydrolase/transferase [Geminicoccus sp.]